MSEDKTTPGPNLCALTLQVLPEVYEQFGEKSASVEAWCRVGYPIRACNCRYFESMAGPDCDYGECIHFKNGCTNPQAIADAKKRAKKLLSREL